MPLQCQCQYLWVQLEYVITNDIFVLYGTKRVIWIKVQINVIFLKFIKYICSRINYYSGSFFLRNRHRELSVLALLYLHLFYPILTKEYIAMMKIFSPNSNNTTHILIYSFDKKSAIGTGVHGFKRLWSDFHHFSTWDGIT